MTQVQTLAAAKVFPNHRSMIAAVAELMNAGQVAAYSIHTNKDGVSAGVRVGEQWGYLA